MRKTRWTKQFRRDYKRFEKSGNFSNDLVTLKLVLELLVADEPLPRSFSDHRMKGRFNDCRDCHLRGDLILVYRKTANNSLELIRLGTHAALEL